MLFTLSGEEQGSIIALACALLLGCGPTSSNGSPAQGGSGGRAAGAGASAGGSATTAGDGNQAGGAASGQSGAGNGGAGGGASSLGAVGTIQVGRLLGNPGGFAASARFSTKDAVTAYDCQYETFGDCQVSTCTENGKTPSPSPSAGDITLTDGKMVNVKLTATPGSNSYTDSTAGSGGVSGGELLTVSASGADVPAFMTEVGVPRVITISAPTLDDTGMANAPIDGDLVLTFDNRAADGETGTVLLAQSLGGIGRPTLACQLPTESGTATIQAAALAKVRGEGQLLLITSRTKVVQAGDFAVSVIAYMSATNTAKTQAAVIHL